ncbi:MAG: hypothetical protein M5U32_15605 [Myxococcota bacterium]|nr:hypothetical protein [Myxococcota bacterium]MCZ7619645.1 hypothetical protein [Myxococcota bacterium]
MARRREVAVHLDLSETRVKQLAAAGVLDPPAGIDSARAAYLRHLRDVAEQRSGPPGSLDLTAERALLARVQREKLAFELDCRRAEYVPAGEAEEALQALARMLDDELSAFTRAAAQAVAGLRSTAECDSALREAVDAARNRIADRLAGLDPEPTR